MYESNGPDVKIRGTASHIAEKYLQLARDAQSSGDPIAAENYYQHAEHYFRLIAAAQEQLRQNQPYFQQQQPGGGVGGNMADDGYDDGDDQPQAGEPYAPQSQPFYPREPQHNQHQPQTRISRINRNSTSPNSRSISRSNFNRVRSRKCRTTKAMLNGCRHSLPAVSLSSRAHRNTAKARMAKAAAMGRTAMTGRRTDFRCTGGVGGIAAAVRATMGRTSPSPPKIARRSPTRIRSTNSR